MYYAQLRQLQLVSRSFYQAFQHPSVSDEVLIKGPLSLKQLRRLLCWVRVHASVISVVRFIDCETDHQGTVLQALLPLPRFAEGLTTFYANDVSREALCILPSFTCLTTCTLLAQNEMDYIDLSPLKLLPSLHVLALMGPGVFIHLYMLPHLTRLHLLDLNNESLEDPPFQSLPTIKQLDLFGASLHDLADRGLFTCEGLQALHCADSFVVAANAADTFCMSGGVPSAAMTSLSQLTELQLCYSAVHRRDQADPIDLNWVRQLTTLQALTLETSRPGCICEHLTCLSRLTALDLGGRWRGDGKLSQWDVLLVDWTKMNALKTISVIRCGFKASSRLLGLSQLPHLQMIWLIESKPADEVSAASIVGLQKRISSHRPDVALVLQDHWVQGHHWQPEY